MVGSQTSLELAIDSAEEGWTPVGALGQWRGSIANKLQTARSAVTAAPVKR
ncbi:MAG: hypothetical protein LBJ69_02980 [Holosporales bacterium]|nr:hypothetical protein [Holosporales bacterium]